MDTTTQKLSAKRVHEILLDCLYKDGEDTAGHIKSEGVLNTFGFHPERIAGHKPEIGELLAELPDEFHREKGGGWSFLNACMDRHGNHWAEHRTIEELLVLGIGTGQAKILMPRPMWQIMPGGMPYFSVL